MNKFETIFENHDWTVEYNAGTHRYRVTYFGGEHYIDEVIFDEFPSQPPETCN